MNDAISENIEYSKEWLTKEIIKTDFENKKNNKQTIIQMSKMDLLKFVLSFVKLNEKGEEWKWTELKG